MHERESGSKEKKERVMISKKKNIFLSVMTATLLSACVSNGMTEAEIQATRAADADRHVAERLARSAATIENTLRVLERLERGTGSENVKLAHGKEGLAATGESVSPALVAAGDPLNAKLALSWNGSAEELLKELGKQLGVATKVSGMSKTEPATVKLDYPNGVSSVDLLTEIGRQITSKAELIYDKSAVVLELRYR